MQDNVHDTGEQKWVGSAQMVHLGKSRGRTTYNNQAGEWKWVGSAQSIHLGKSRDRM
ncbi:hypothetical protein FA13DRAFT_1732951, partial [Coprinellus micaceus]